jgi:hypothetical protein
MSQHTHNSVAAAAITADERSFNEQLHSGSPTVPREPNVNGLFDYGHSPPSVRIDTLFDYGQSPPSVSIDMLFDYDPSPPELLFDYPQDVTAPPHPDSANRADYECQNVCTSLEKDATRWAGGDNLLDSIQQTNGSRSQDGLVEPPGRQQQPSGPIAYRQDYGLNTGSTLPVLSQL